MRTLLAVSLPLETETAHWSLPSVPQILFEVHPQALSNLPQAKVVREQLAG